MFVAPFFFRRLAAVGLEVEAGFVVLAAVEVEAGFVVPDWHLPTCRLVEAQFSWEEAYSSRRI